MSGHLADRAEPNLTPLLDMVFQLITFFMLVMNFKGASLDLSLKLPVLGSARPLDRNGQPEPLILNIDSQGKVKAYGQQIDVDHFIGREARLLRLLNRDSEKSSPEGDLPGSVMIRADRSVSFHQVNDVLKICQQHGYRQFALSAMSHEEKRP